VQTPASPSLTSDLALESAVRLAGAVRTRVGEVLRGKPEPVELALVALLSGGHLLVEDVPGVGKTLLAKALARSVGGMFRRVQCTPDLLPSELTGVSVFHLAGNEWEFRPGPLFAHVVLVDELNRATPRTQSALLEAMEERQVTVDGITRPLPHPFFLVATQNPYETTGTFPLVEGQLDRFTIVTRIGPPDAATERELLLGAGGEDALSDLDSVSDPVALADAIMTARRVHCEPTVADYVIGIARATREHPDVAIGASPRASLALVHAAQAHALLAGRRYVVPDDVKRLAVPVLAHRLVLRDPTTLAESQAFLGQIVGQVPAPRP
jgi:MoxR-like ATPase